MRIINWSQLLSKPMGQEEITPLTLLGDALSMTLLVAVFALATLAYGL
jgi:hypothetical protein